MARDGEVARNYAIIGGQPIYLDELMNPKYLRASEITALRERLYGAAPFAHLVIDDLFSKPLLEEMAEEYDRVPRNTWKLSEHAREDRRGTLPYARMGHATDLYFQTIYSTRFLHFMTQLTAIPDLVTDPSLLNGGLHDVPTGGRFDIHIDYTHHPVTGLANRLVMITYLNKNWKDDYGGQLELWNAATKTCDVSIVPEFGRTIMFMNGPTALHGCPRPIAEPTGRSRRSAAAYFYSPDRSASDAPHYTRYLEAARPHAGLMRTIRPFVPPILLDGARRLKSMIAKKA